MTNVLSVTQLNSYIKSIIDGDKNLNRVFIVGEISNLTIHYKSGHIYLSLKDDKAIIKGVMFATSARRMKFVPKDGMKVLVRGRVSVYEGSGQYQLYIEDMQPDGLGALNLAYEQLWEKLNNEGIFNKTLKKSLPKYPSNIAVITSPTGAAVRDIISILDRRWNMANVTLYPCTVQGENAVPELINAMQKADCSNADVIIIGRGGGSLEDLWAFNDEQLARIIFNAKKPVISAVGHENDYTICDYVADVRASTPSAAAELAVPNKTEEMQNVLGYKNTIDYLVTNKIRDLEIKLDSFTSPIKLMENKLTTEKENLSRITHNYKIYSKMYVDNRFHELSKITLNLDGMSPLKVISRGYSVLQKDGKTVTSVNDVNTGDTITALLNDGELALTVLKEN